MYEQIIYIGDGHSDICPSRCADLVFAKEVLLKKCEEEGTTPYQSFHDFSAISEYLKKIFDGRGLFNTLRLPARDFVMSISKKIKASISQSSMIRKMFEEGIILKKKYGADKVYDFSLGNPNVEHPEEFKKELIHIADQEIALKHGYTPNAGYLETRQAVAQKISKTTGLKMTADHVVMSCGAGGALNVILKSLLDPGDEVIILKPFFVEYPFYIENYGGVVKYATTRADFSLDIDAISKAITRKTKAIIINSPNNPTGRVYSKKNIADLARLLKEKEQGAAKSHLSHLG